MKTIYTLAILAIATLACAQADARDWYVSAKRGKGKKGTKKKPAKDLGNILKKIAPGDTVHIAQGVYMGRGKNGSNTILVPISIIGGYDDTFSKRDPWGKHRTIFGGDNLSKNWPSGGPPAIFMDLMKFGGDAVPIVVDGVIVDHGYRNRYVNKEETKLAPKANPKTGQNPSPGMGALVIRVSKSAKFDRGPRWSVVVKNCIVMNAYQNQGALSVSGYKGTKVTIRNNAVIQTSGSALFIGSKWRGDDKDNPTFLVENNTVLFSWDSGFSQGFNVSFDKQVKATLKNNVFAFSDIYAINNGLGTKNVLLINNLIAGARKADYKEFNTQMAIGEIEDAADLLHDDTQGNISSPIKVPVSKEFALLYGSRVVVDRAKAEAGVKASNGSANDLRKMLGLPTQAGAIKWPKSPVYINRISVDDAIKAASTKYLGKHGSSKPKG